jgi:UDP-sulfoquinovose synthase
VEIFNQVAETLRIEDVARLISNQTGVPVAHLTNPRKEDASNELEVAHEKFANLGLHAITLELALLDEVVNVAKKYKYRAKVDKVISTSYWNKERAKAARNGGVLVQDMDVTEPLTISIEE